MNLISPSVTPGEQVDPSRIPSGPIPSERFHSLDALRAFAMLLGIYLHAGVPYMTSPPPFWPAHLRDGYHHLGHDLLIFLIHCFRMELFFVMAGFFGHLVLQRKGIGEFVRHRALRIGVPFVLGWALMIVLLPLSIGWRPFTDARYTFPAHLWFLYYLLLFCGLAALVSWIYQPAGQFAVGKGAIPRAFAWVLRSPLQSLWLALLSIPFLLTMHTPVVDTPLAYYPIPRVAAYYGVFFAVGWMLHRQKELLPSVERWRWWSIGRAVVLTVPLLVLVEIALSKMRETSNLPNNPAIVLLRLLYGVYTWLLIFGLTGLFLRYLKGHRPVIRYLADSAYWLYIMHLPLVLFLQWRLVDSKAVPGPLKIAVILVITVTVLLVTYQLFVRHTVIGWVLNGPRRESRAAA